MLVISNNHPNVEQQYMCVCEPPGKIDPNQQSQKIPRVNGPFLVDLPIKDGDFP